MKKVLLALSLALVFGLTACSTDDGNENEGTPDTVATEDLATEDTESPAPQCPGLPDLTGRSYRVTSLVAKEPTDKVNDVWAADIADYELVILFNVVSHNVEAGTLELRVTSATAEKEQIGEDQYKPIKYNYMLDPAIFDAYLDGCRIRWDSPIELDIVTSTISKPFHVFGITGYCDMNQDGSEITKSWLSGAILETEAQDLCMTIPGMGVANFHWFMNLAHICPDFDADKDGSLESYKFSGELKGVDESELFDSAIIPFETDIECDLHDEVCIP